MDHFIERNSRKDRSRPFLVVTSEQRRKVIRWCVANVCVDKVVKSAASVLLMWALNLTFEYALYIEAFKLVNSLREQVF